MLSINETSAVEQLPILSSAIPEEPTAVDKLASDLAEVARELKGSEAAGEQQMRCQVIIAVNQYTRSRHELGRVLSGYRAHFKTEGTWLRVCEVLATALNKSSRTVFRIIDEYHRISEVPATLLQAFESLGIKPAALKNASLMETAMKMHFDEGASTERIAEYLRDVERTEFTDPRDAHRKVSPEDRNLFKMTDALRRGLSTLPPEQRLECLRQILGELSLRVLNQTSAFTLEITPIPGPLTVDGRVREQEEGTR